MFTDKPAQPNTDQKKAAQGGNSSLQAFCFPCETHSEPSPGRFVAVN